MAKAVLYRIAPERFLEVYTGTGASYRDGGRWNLPGDPVLYFATSPSLAMLEMSHYLPSPRHVPASYRLGVYEAEDASMETREVASLPKGWAAFPYPVATQTLGSEWLRARSGLILKVPSCAVPGGLEPIAVVNPRHEEIMRLQLIESIPATYNPRVFKEP
ncbi:RES family NAD+ phosphorylase [Halomonas sp. BM-2019]|uniref:RES family NAD+ phosphorylase n=1 Tax=Halomonas sp. BM-2019 TaxID=2811227 RepID=UPI001B3C3B38|nr:MAG: RES family NAD+ phosphorylase [Halomonas sp. BM-2019]